MKIKQFFTLLGLSLCCIPYLGAETRFIRNEVVVTPTAEEIKKVDNNYIMLGDILPTPRPFFNNARYRLCGINQDIPQAYTLQIESFEHLFEPSITGFDSTIMPTSDSPYGKGIEELEKVALYSNTNLMIGFDMSFSIDLNPLRTYYRNATIKVFDRSSMPYKKIKYSCYPENNPQSEEKVQGELTILLGNFSIQTSIAGTCTNQQKNQIVTLKPTSKNALDKQGEILAGDFSLRLNCNKTSVNNMPPGIFGNIGSIYVQFTDQSNPSNNGNILTLTHDSNAKGVGLKIYPANNNSQAVQFSPVQTDVLKTIQGGAGITLGDYNGVPITNNLNYKVHYVKTGEITPGSVQGIATVTFFYP